LAPAVGEQRAATREIARNVQQAAQGATDISLNIVGPNRAAEGTGAAASQVLSPASGLGRDSALLKRQGDAVLLHVRAA
jgi:methyl-accepting chemotaxis protein